MISLLSLLPIYAKAISLTFAIEKHLTLLGTITLELRYKENNLDPSNS